MIIPEFASCLKDKIRTFCTLNYSDGTHYKTPLWVMGSFDRFLSEMHCQENYPTRQIIDAYLQSICHLASKTRANYMNPVRQFCLYLALSHPNCCIPDPVSHAERVHTPYIFTRQEVARLAVQAGKLPPERSFRGLTLKTLFIFLYVTGMRIGETLALKLKDFYPQNLRLLVFGKFRKTRWVPIKPSTCTALENYIQLRQERTPLTPDAPLFVNIRNRQLSYGAVHTAFQQLVTQCQIGSGQNPHIHDLRHSFAVTRLLQWYRDGQEINTRLPSLATYMGHVEIRSTQTYLHATPELKQEIYQRSLSYVQTHVLKKGGFQ